MCIRLGVPFCVSILASARKNDASVGVRNRYYCMHELETGITHLRIQHLGGIFFWIIFWTTFGYFLVGRIWTTVSRSIRPFFGHRSANAFNVGQVMFTDEVCLTIMHNSVWYCNMAFTKTSQLSLVSTSRQLNIHSYTRGVE